MWKKYMAQGLFSPIFFPRRVKKDFFEHEMFHTGEKVSFWKDTFSPTDKKLFFRLRVKIL